MSADEIGCVCFHARRGSRAVSQFYDRFMRPAGIRSAQYAMLSFIHRNENTSVGELAEFLCMDQSTATRNLERLEKENYVEFSVCPDDGRRKLLRLTSAGEEKLSEASSLWEAAQDVMRDRLGQDDFRALVRILGKVAALTRN